ncbi:MAG: hypothetical protein U0359_24830 [Byssovorax sp.]
MILRPSPALLVAIAALGAACGAPPSPSPPPPAEPRPVASARPPPAPGARYLAPGAQRIERDAQGITRAVVDGRRVEIRGAELVRTGPAEPEVQGGGVGPRWAGDGPNRYLFWAGRELYGAASFDGALHRIASLPAEPQGTFDWMNGTGILLPGGALVMPPRGDRPVSLGRPAVTRAAAIGPNLGVILDALGRVLVTTDGGRSFRDATDELGSVQRIEARGAAIAVLLRDGRERFVDGAGAVVDRPPPSPPDPAARPDPPLDPWPGGEAGAIASLARAGLPLDDGGVVIADDGLVGRFDPASLRTTSVVPLAGLSPEAECVAFRAADGPLLACADPRRATVIDLAGAPRIERTFDLAGAPDLDRFLGDDGEAIGFLGPCDGRPPPAPPADRAAGTPNGSSSRSAVFCVRKGPDAWVEHELDGADATEVIAWIPRRLGGAIALLGRTVAAQPGEARVSVRGDLRIVRLDRGEPPLSLSSYGSERSPVVLDRSLHAAADGTIEGFLPGGSFTEVAAVSIDPSGRAKAFPLPQGAGRVVSAGRFALVETDDGLLFETTDHGRRWRAIEPPPGGSSHNLSRCSPAGCAIGSFVRLGWGSPSDPSSAARGEVARDRGSMSRVAPPPLLRMRCAASAPATGKRSAEPLGFGAAPGPQSRGMITVRIGTLGAASYPYANGGAMPSQGDLDLGWISPLDLSGEVHRRALPLGRLGLGAGAPRMREMRLGAWLDPEGGLEPFPIGYRDTCPASILEQAGIVRPIGGCAEDRAVGVEIGGRVFFARPAFDALVVSVATPPPRAKGPGAGKGSAPSAAPAALRDLSRLMVPTGLRAFALGAGERRGEPVAVVMDASGEALLVPVNAATGLVGAEERLALLGAARLGSDPACSAPGPADEARVFVSFEGKIGLDRDALPGVLTTTGAASAVLRWSSERACLDALELGVRDERHEPDLGLYEGAGAVRKVVARFARGTRKEPPRAALVLAGAGYELVQPLACDGLRKGEAAVP